MAWYDYITPWGQMEKLQKLPGWLQPDSPIRAILGNSEWGDRISGFAGLDPAAFDSPKEALYSAFPTYTSGRIVNAGLGRGADRQSWRGNLTSGGITEALLGALYFGGAAAGGTGPFAGGGGGMMGGAGAGPLADPALAFGGAPSGGMWGSWAANPGAAGPLSYQLPAEAAAGGGGGAGSLIGNAWDARSAGQMADYQTGLDQPWTQGDELGAELDASGAGDAFWSDLAQLTGKMMRGYAEAEREQALVDYGAADRNRTDARHRFGFDRYGFPLENLSSLGRLAGGGR